MSYAICNVICGCDLPDEIRELQRECRGGNCELDLDNIGFVGLYIASGETPAYCGVDLFEFGECLSVNVRELQRALNPTESQMLAAEEKLRQAREAFKEYLESLGDEVSAEERESLLDTIPTTPYVFLLWSSS